VTTSPRAGRVERWDDLPIHQTAAVLAEPASDDPRAYERYWFGFGALDGSAMLGLVVNVHPNLGVVDAVFSVSDGARSESLFARDLLAAGRERIVAGPVALTLDDPMRSLRIAVHGSGFDVDLTFSATTPAITEDRVTRIAGGRIVQDRTRYVQLGTVDGRASTPLGAFDVDAASWRAGRDHSWGIWDAPAPDAVPRPAGHGPSFCWLIGAFDDLAMQAVTHAEPDGTRYGEYGAVVPTLAAGAEVAGPGAGQEPLSVRGFDLTTAAGTRHVDTATVTVEHGAASSPIPVQATSLHAVLPRTVGYAHPGWVSGRIPERTPEVATESWVLADLDMLARENHRSLQFMRLERPDGTVGYGFVDQQAAAE
jgi:hypothetical protein